MRPKKVLIVGSMVAIIALLFARWLMSPSEQEQKEDQASKASEGPTSAESDAKQEQKTESASPTLGTPLTPAQRNAQVKTKDLSIGANKKADEGSKVSFNIIMKLMNGKVVFDSAGEGRPWTGVIGNGSLLNGIDRGIRGMYQGGKRAIWIPAHFAYGSHGINDHVPPGSDVYAEIELLSVF